MQGGHAVYALDDRVERPVRLCLDAAFFGRTDSRLTFRCGVSLRSDRTRFYRQMRDLLGAGYVTDIDRYLVDDDTYSNLLQNDLRHPDRTIREGDRFGYDYAIRSREIRARFCAEYRSDRFRFDLCAELGAAAVRRRGFYEKELFPGALSYGPSRTVRFAPWRLKALAGWSFSPRSYLEAAVMAGAEPPLSEALFYQPSYNNRSSQRKAPAVGKAHLGGSLDPQAETADPRNGHVAEERRQIVVIAPAMPAGATSSRCLSAARTASPDRPRSRPRRSTPSPVRNASPTPSRSMRRCSEPSISTVRG